MGVYTECRYEDVGDSGTPVKYQYKLEAMIYIGPPVPLTPGKTLPVDFRGGQK
jgi:hypothetical protein